MHNHRDTSRESGDTRHPPPEGARDDVELVVYRGRTASLRGGAGREGRGQGACACADTVHARKCVTWRKRERPGKKRGTAKPSTTKIKPNSLQTSPTMRQVQLV